MSAIERGIVDPPDGYEIEARHKRFGRMIGPIYKWTKTDEHKRAFIVEEKHINNSGLNCHGGMMMAFADLALGIAVRTRFDRPWVTVRLITDFVAGAKLGELVEGTGKIYGIENDFITIKGEIWSGERTLVICSGVFKLM